MNKRGVTSALVGIPYLPDLETCPVVDGDPKPRHAVTLEN